ncbi:uncharacterized protein DUF3822 [Gelidibacter sediminis]|uniref:Uncharacterized protein DUF3822 n=1 Tax=Gelidibacter sediminis TaxID=1608710 RepID=A0A4R7Q189_9FLAO|nr:DUF3822 family protein [Gelidibacter sediminis]TDU40210.1 uncharacterized protein DUF3822 [Gelidibacter sediminis]
MESIHLKKLSIQISLSGLSFCILNTADKTVDYLKRIDFKIKQSPEAILEHLKNAIADEPLLRDTFDSVLVLFQNDLSNVVPQQFFNEEHSSDYLKFSSKIIKTDFISHDTIEVNNSVNVFVPYVNINNYIFEVYGAFEYKHASTILIEHALQETQATEETKLYINVAPVHFEMVVVHNGQLQLYNTFDYHTKEDFLYYILFVIEQLKLDPETLLLTLSGSIEKDDELYKLLYTYIRFVSFEEPSKALSFDLLELQVSKHQHALILNSFNL